MLGTEVALRQTSRNDRLACFSYAEVGQNSRFLAKGHVSLSTTPLDEGANWRQVQQSQAFAEGANWCHPTTFDMGKHFRQPKRLVGAAFKITNRAGKSVVLPPTFCCFWILESRHRTGAHPFPIGSRQMTSANGLEVGTGRVRAQSEVGTGRVCTHLSDWNQAQDESALD